MAQACMAPSGTGSLVFQVAEINRRMNSKVYTILFVENGDFAVQIGNDLKDTKKETQTFL